MTRISLARSMVWFLTLLTLTCCSPARRSEEVFEAVWETFDEHYALFEVKSIDWPALYDEYRPRAVAAPSEELKAQALAEHEALIRGTG